jgi:hypothetical protein
MVISPFYQKMKKNIPINLKEEKNPDSERVLKKVWFIKQN